MSKKSHHSKYLTYGLFAGAVSTLGLLSASQTVSAQQLTVKTGDTIWGLSQQHGLSVSALEQANPSIKQLNDSVDLIFAGQQLTLPSTATDQAVNTDGSYTVKPGDTLGLIAEQYHVSVQQLMTWNNLSAEDSIYIGQRLIIDGTGFAAVSQPAVTTATQNVNSQVSVASEQPQSAPLTGSTTSNQQVTISAQPVVNAQPATTSKAASNTVAASSTPSSVAATTTVTTNTAVESGAVTSTSSAVNQSAVTMSTQDFVPSQASASSDLARYAAQSFVQVPTTQASQATVSQTGQSTSATTQPAASQVTQQSTVAQSQTAATVADQAQPTSSVAQPAQSTAPAQQSQASASQDLQQGSVVSLATKIANSNSVPYVWGGNSLSGMDCSGLVDYVYANAEGKQLPHNTVALESYVNQHAVSEAQPGDLLFWGNHGSTYHTAIYTGNNQYVAAAKPGTNVATYTISPYFQPSFAGTVK